jgi:hypothetical protein
LDHVRRYIVKSKTDTGAIVVFVNLAEEKAEEG